MEWGEDRGQSRLEHDTLLEIVYTRTDTNRHGGIKAICLVYFLFFTVREIH